MLHKRIVFKDPEGNQQEFDLAVGQCGKGAPTSNTPCCSGITYLDEDTGKLYKCVLDGKGGHKWEEIPCNDDMRKAVSDAIAEAIASGEIKGEKGDTGDQGPKGDKGNAGVGIASISIKEV